MLDVHTKTLITSILLYHRLQVLQEEESDIEVIRNQISE